VFDESQKQTVGTCNVLGQDYSNKSHAGRCQWPNPRENIYWAL